MAVWRGAVSKSFGDLHRRDEFLSHGLLLLELGGGGVHERPAPVVDGQVRHDAPLAPGARHRERVHQPSLDAVYSRGDDAHGGPRSIRGAVHPVPDVVAHGRRRGEGGAELPGGDDRGAALLHGGDELAVEVRVVVHELPHGLVTRGCVVDIRVLGGRVVAPDDAVLDVGDGHAGALGDLAERAVVVQAGEAGDVLLGDLGSVVGQDERVGVGGVGHDDNLDVGAGVLLQGGRLALVDGHVLGHDVLTLHAGTTGEATDHDGDVDALARLLEVHGGDDLFHQRVGGIDELHGDTLQRGLGGGDVQKVENDRRIGAEHGAAAYLRGERIANLASGARDHHGDGSNHGVRSKWFPRDFSRDVSRLSRVSNFWERSFTLAPERSAAYHGDRVKK